jgi:signal transduction histidine kinase
MRSSEKKISDTENNLKELFRNFPLPTYAWQKVNDDLVLINYNIAADEITDGKLKNLLGIKASELFEDDPEILNDLNRCVNEKVNLSRDTVYTFKNMGEVKNFNIRYGYASPDLFVILTEDITERNKAEQKLKESERTYREAYDLVNIYKELFAHEMNNILQSILSSAEYYSFFQDDNEKLKNFGDIYELIKMHIKRGVSLISKMRTLSELEETEKNLIPINIFDVLTKSVENTKRSFHITNVNVNIKGLLKDMKVLGDTFLIHVFDNNDISNSSG